MNDLPTSSFEQAVAKDKETIARNNKEWEETGGFGGVKNADLAWRNKASRIIARECFIAYAAANTLPNGRMRKRHVPYGLPPLAQQLLNYLNTNDEAAAKDLFWRILVFGSNIE